MTAHSHVYTSNVYLLRGEWNSLEDMTTLVDVGLDPALPDALEGMSTGVGKKRVDMVVLTHSHYDHASMLGEIRARYSPRVYAVSQSLPDVDHHPRNHETLRLGDEMCELLTAPFHSSDSLCIYCPQTHALFSGDVQVVRCAPDGTWHPGFASFLRDLVQRRIDTIYPGHGDPITSNVPGLLRQSLYNVTGES